MTDLVMMFQHHEHLPDAVLAFSVIIIIIVVISIIIVVVVVVVVVVRCRIL